VTTGPSAGIRDASWYDFPRHDHGRESNWAPRYHVESEEYDGTPACNPNRALLHSMVDASDVPEHMRCCRPGCRVRWPSLGSGDG
jgi:hypothetical protein